MCWLSIFVLAFCGLVKGPMSVIVFGECPLRTGTANGCFPLSPRDGAKRPVGTQKVLIGVDFLTYYLNMLNGP